MGPVSQPKKTVKKVCSKKKTKKVKRKNYTTESVQNALKAVKNGTAIREAARMFGVPRATITRKINNLQNVNNLSGPPTVFSEDIENDIVDWIVYRSTTGNPVTKTVLLDSVEKYVQQLNLKTPFKENRPGRHWYEGFRKRHPQLTIRTPQNLVSARANVTEEDMRDWFQEVGNFLQEKQLISIDRSRIFNADETNLQLCPKFEKVITKRGAKSVYAKVDASERENLSVLFIYSPAGVRAPPMVMFNYKEGVPKRILENCPTGWAIGNSESGWQTTETFFEYITNVWHPWLVSNNVQFPVVLYVDGHGSHVTIPLVKFCRANQIEIVKLYPHSTHISQPLDVSFFAPFKAMWKKIVPRWKLEKNISRLRKENCPEVIKMTLENMLNEQAIIVSGFKCCGLVPFNAEAIEYNVFDKKKKKRNSSEISAAEKLEMSTVKKCVNNDEFLKTFEDRLPVGLLQEFEKSKTIGYWTGENSSKHLFEFWLQIKNNNCTNNEQQEEAPTSII